MIDRYDVVITGGSGYIGSPIVRDLISEGYKVKVVDLLDGNDIVDTCNLCSEWLIHLASHVEVGSSFTKSAEYFHNNNSKYHAFLNHNNNKFSNVIYSSSAAVYDDCTEVRPLSVYGMTKLTNEFITQSYTQNSLILRFANPVGISGLESKCGDGVFFKLAESSTNGENFNIHDSDDMTRNFFPLSWISEIILKTLNSKNPEYGVIDLASNKTVRVKQLLTKICYDHNISHTLTLTDVGSVVHVGLPCNTEYLSNIIQGWDDFNPESYINEEFSKYKLHSIKHK